MLLYARRIKCGVRGFRDKGYRRGAQHLLCLQPEPERSQTPEFRGVLGEDLVAMDGERLGVYLGHLDLWKLRSVGDLEILLSIPFTVTFDRLGRSGEVLHQGEESVTFKTGQKDIQGAVKGSVPPWSLGNQGANPHENISGHKAGKKVTRSSQYGLIRLAKDKSGLISLITL